jgi:hypothetical protein
MVVKNQKNMIHDVVMNFIPKKKTEPPKVSLEQMVKEHTKLLEEKGKTNQHIQRDQFHNTNVISQPSHTTQPVNVINEIEKRYLDKPITISKIESPTISDVIMPVGGDILKKPNSRKRSRNISKSTVEKLIDSKLKSEFIENFINNNSNTRQPTNKAKSPKVTNNIKKSRESNIKSLTNNNIKIENNTKSPVLKKFKSENNINQKHKIVQNKDQLFKIPLKKTSNTISNNISNTITNNARYNNINNNSLNNLIHSKNQNRTNNYLKNISNKNKNEADIKLDSFRDYEIKIKNSRKKSKKNNIKRSNKYKCSRKNSNKKSKVKSNSISKDIKINKGVPNYLKEDLKQLIGNNITINNDNFNFN